MACSSAELHSDLFDFGADSDAEHPDEVARLPVPQSLSWPDAAAMLASAPVAADELDASKAAARRHASHPAAASSLDLAVLRQAVCSRKLQANPQEAGDMLLEALWPLSGQPGASLPALSIQDSALDVEMTQDMYRTAYYDAHSTEATHQELAALHASHSGGDQQPEEAAPLTHQHQQQQLERPEQQSEQQAAPTAPAALPPRPPQAPRQQAQPAEPAHSGVQQQQQQPVPAARAASLPQRKSPFQDVLEPLDDAQAPVASEQVRASWLAACLAHPLFLCLVELSSCSVPDDRLLR